MVERHRAIDFATGALVFPGGRADASDSDPAVRERCEGMDGLDDLALTARVAGIRETFEEAGVLLARARGADVLVSGARLDQLASRYRDALARDEVAIAEVLEREDLVLACDLLVPFAHWITPEPSPKRYDTYFFLAAAPDDHAAEHDGHESVDSLWITPAEALAAGVEGRRTVIFATQMNLKKLARSKSVEQALDAARQDTIVTVLPQRGQRADGEHTIVIPAEAGYGGSEFPLDPEGWKTTADALRRT